MEPRGWWTVGLTALAGPLGAVAGAFVLYTVGGNFGLAAGVGGPANAPGDAEAASFILRVQA